MRRAAAILGGLWLVLAGLTSAAPAAAQGVSGLQGGDKPMEIDADEGIEWRRDINQYIARGNARAAQGDVEVLADVLTAHYRPDADGGSEIYQIDADGNVRIVSPDQVVYADRARYDMERSVIVLTGDNLKLENGQDVITARDTLEYWEERQIAVARGNAVAQRQDKRVRADLLTAYLVPDANDKLEIDRVDLKGNVQVASPTEYAEGTNAVYYVKREFATLSGNVKITRGENQLNGEYAEVDLASGISRLLSAPPGRQERDRVRGLIIPKRKPSQGTGS